MAAPVPEVEPTRVSAGETLLFTRELEDYPANLWTLSYVITNSARAYSFAASASGLIHSVNVAKATSALWVAGDYQLNGIVTGGSPEEQHSVYSGLLTILPDKSSTTALEYRSWAQVALANIEAALVIDAGRGSVLEYTINGRSVRASYSDAIKMRDYLKSQVQLDQWGGRQRKILTRFRSARNSSSEPFV